MDLALIQRQLNKVLHQRVDVLERSVDILQAQMNLLADGIDTLAKMTGHLDELKAELEAKLNPDKVAKEADGGSHSDK